VRLFLYDTANPNSVAWAQAAVATKGHVAYCQVEKPQIKELANLDTPGESKGR
jgi:hypothetical protein